LLWNASDVAALSAAVTTQLAAAGPVRIWSNKHRRAGTRPSQRGQSRALMAAAFSSAILSALSNLLAAIVCLGWRESG